MWIMKIMYLIDTKKYGYHKEVADQFLEIIPGEVTDMCNDADQASVYYGIEDAKADVIITFDGCGLDLRTVTDTLSLNNIYARFAHIMFHKTSFYGPLFGARQNLSMFTYVPKGEDITGLKEKYTEVPNITEFPEFYYKAAGDDERAVNRDNIKMWWDTFRKDAML